MFHIKILLSYQITKHSTIDKFILLHKIQEVNKNFSQKNCNKLFHLLQSSFSQYKIIISNLISSLITESCLSPKLQST